VQRALTRQAIKFEIFEMARHRNKNSAFLYLTGVIFILSQVLAIFANSIIKHESETTKLTNGSKSIPSSMNPHSNTVIISSSKNISHPDGQNFTENFENDEYDDEEPRYLQNLYDIYFRNIF